MAQFIIDYETPNERTKTGHRINVRPIGEETDWEALMRVVQDRGLKLMRASTTEKSEVVREQLTE